MIRLEAAPGSHGRKIRPGRRIPCLEDTQDGIVLADRGLTKRLNNQTFVVTVGNMNIVDS